MTPDGARILVGPQRQLIRGVIGMMLDWLVSECRLETGQWVYGIDWYDQWDSLQRAWLLEVASKALLASTPPPPRWAVFEATIDAVFAELRSLIKLEINEDERRPGASWRCDLLTAVESISGASPSIAADSTDGDHWNRLVARLSDSITGPVFYPQVEAYRDGDPSRLQTFLKQRALPEDYLTAIPPIITVSRAQLAIDRISGLVFEQP